MLPIALPADGLLLDVGGWAKPLARADWVIDLMPYATRGLYGHADGEERFTEQTWVEQDVCEPWPFDDGQFDFAVCSHTLEDVRDPVFVCKELQRVAKAGYIEVPSRVEEHMTGVNGPWAGWSHHRWVCDIDPFAGRIEFVHKHNAIPTVLYKELPIERRVQWLWWNGSFDVRERIFMDIAEAHAWFGDVLRAIV
jgi:Methyltransferase domain